MSYIRVKTIKGRSYAYRQTSVRKGKKVKTISEYLGALAMAPLIGVALATGYRKGPPGGRGADRPTDKRSMQHQEEGDRELFRTNRGAFNVRQQQDYERGQKARDAAKEAREARMSRSERQECDDAKAEAQGKWDEGMEAVKQFNEAKAQEKGSPSAYTGDPK